METSKSYKLQMHKHNDCMRTHTRTLTPTNPNAHSFTTTQTQDQLNILRRIWTTEHAFGKISLSESRKASPVKELSQNKKRKLGGGGPIPGVIWWEGEWTWHPCVWTVGGCWRTWKESLQTQTTHKRNSTISNIKQIHTHTVWGCKRTFLLKKGSMGNESLRT